MLGCFQTRTAKTDTLDKYARITLDRNTLEGPWLKGPASEWLCEYGALATFIRPPMIRYLPLCSFFRHRSDRSSRDVCRATTKRKLVLGHEQHDISEPKLLPESHRPPCAPLHLGDAQALTCSCLLPGHRQGPSATVRAIKLFCLSTVTPPRLSPAASVRTILPFSLRPFSQQYCASLLLKNTNASVLPTGPPTVTNKLLRGHRAWPVG